MCVCVCVCVCVCGVCVCVHMRACERVSMRVREMLNRHIAETSEYFIFHEALCCKFPVKTSPKSFSVSKNIS